MKLWFGTPGWGWRLWGVSNGDKWFFGLSIKQGVRHDSENVAEIEALRAEVEEMQRRLEREESDHGRAIDQRDAAEDALGRMFQAVSGRTAEWSSAWGYVDAIEEVEEHVATLATERDQLAAALEAAQMGLRYAVRVWVLSDEIEWSEAEIDEVVESIISDAKKEDDRE